MDERLQFVTRRLAGETMAELCREFGISRKTGYKIFDRYPVQATLAPGSLLLVTMVLDGGWAQNRAQCFFLGELQCGVKMRLNSVVVPFDFHMVTSDV